MFCRSLFVLLSFFFWPLYCLFFLNLRLLITPLVSCGHCIISPSITASDYPFGICGHCIISPSSITASDYPFGILWPLYNLSFFDYSFWLPLWYLVAIVYSLLRLQLLITPLVSCGHCIISPSSITASDYPFGILWPLYNISFDYSFWLLLWYLVAIV